MTTWDSEDKEPGTGNRGKANKWDEEDEDNATKDNWDDDGESGNQESEEEPEAAAAVQVKKKKSIKEILADKEKAKDEQSKKVENVTDADKSPESKKDVPESQVAGDKQDVEGKGQIDLFEPTTKEEFDKFNKLLQQKLTTYEQSPLYVQFLDNLFREAANNMEADDVKKLISTINAVSNEKVKQQKSTKGKKKSSKKATLAVGKDIEKDEFGGEVDYDDFDDYM